jgi:hypothetical protein
MLICDESSLMIITISDLFQCLATLTVLINDHTDGRGLDFSLSDLF